MRTGPAVRGGRQPRRVARSSRRVQGSSDAQLACQCEVSTRCTQAVADHAKSLVALMVPPFALAAAIVYRRSRRPFVAHAVFSLHFHAFMLLLLSVALLVPAINVWFGGPGLSSRLLDNALAVAHLVLCALYLYIASGPVYGAKGLARVVQAVVLTLGAMLTFLGYRFALLWITLYFS